MFSGPRYHTGLYLLLEGATDPGEEQIRAGVARWKEGDGGEKEKQYGCITGWEDESQ